MSCEKRSATGLFITLEGVEGVGKTTNRDFIVSWLQDRGIDLIVTREPGGTPLAEELRELLLQPRAEEVDALAELLLVFAARAQHFNTRIMPSLRRGQWVICDRFTDATYAYQGGGRGLDLGQIALLERLVHGQRQPDKTILLDMDAEQGLQRARQRSDADRFEQEDVAFFDAVRRAYLRRVEQQPDRFALIDAGQPLDHVQEDIVRVLQALVDQGQSRPPRTVVD